MIESPVQQPPCFCIVFFVCPVVRVPLLFSSPISMKMFLQQESQCPKVWWLYLTWIVHALTYCTLEIWQLEGQLPQTRMRGQTADISQFFELWCYEWWCSMYDDPTISFPRGYTNTRTMARTAGRCWSCNGGMFQLDLSFFECTQYLATRKIISFHKNLDGKWFTSTHDNGNSFNCTSIHNTYKLEQRIKKKVDLI